MTFIEFLGTLHRVKVRTAVDNDTYNDATDNLGQGTSHVDVEDVFLDDNILVEPTDVTHIRDMTATMNRKKSVRYKLI